jgi:hypothetical protein
VIKRRKALAPGSPLHRKTELRRTGWLKSSGPVKPRKTSASGHIPTTIRKAVLARDKTTCQRCGQWLRPDWYSLHHRDARGMGGSVLLHTMANLVAVCGTGTTGCHGEIESFRTDSYATGWLVPNGAAPETWPVDVPGRGWEQPGDEWVPAEPNPRQVEMRGAA